MRAGVNAGPRTLAPAIPLRYGRSMGIAQLWRSLTNALAALLLMGALATPAFAEIICAEESVAHLEQTTVTFDAQQPSSDPSNDDGSGKADHCGFTHGHCSGIASVCAEHPVPGALTIAYAPSVSVSAPSSTLETPDRPPAA